MMRRSIAFFRGPARHSAIVGLALTLAGCAATPAYQPTAPRFDGPPVWQVAADRIEIKTAPGVMPPDGAVAARLAAQPADVARGWAKSRLKADPGASGTVIYMVEKAEAIERYLQREKGVTALFVKNTEAEFTVAFAVNLTQFDASGVRRGGARAESQVIGQLKEGSDEDDRRKLWERLLIDAADRLDQELQKQAPTGLPGARQIR